MITTYHRPQTLDEALKLLNQPNRTPLGGGTLLASRSWKSDPVEAVDLQAIGLNSIKKSGNNLEIGATVTLQQLLESEHTPEALKSALKLETPLNLRNAATVAGTLVTCDGRSTFASVLLALDAKLEQTGLDNSNVETRILSIGEFLPLRNVQGSLITSISLPLHVKLAFDYVSRTPADKPIVCAALAQWNSGRTRLVVGGYGKSPLLAMDGTEAEGLEAAARNAFHEATDEWASAEYRVDVAATLAKRCVTSLL
jgi:putative selenate reductase FAD-binding subunit